MTGNPTEMCFPIREEEREMEVIETVAKSPLPTILGIGGIIFLFLALVGRVGSAKVIVNIPAESQKLLARAGISLILAGILLYMLPFFVPPQREVPAVTPTLALVPTNIPSLTPPPTATAIPPTIPPSPTVMAEPLHTSTPTATQPTPNPEPQQVRWGPVDGREAGVFINGYDGFFPWIKLEEEIQQRLLPQVSEVPHGSTVALKDLEGKRDWVVQIIGPRGNEIGNIWLGPDPSKDWAYDGLVRVGKPGAPPVVWDTFQRYSDGSYRKQ